MSEFYAGRTHCQYYTLVREWLEGYGRRAAILDIGCADTPVASWGDFRNRYALDTRLKPKHPSIITVDGQWPNDAARLPSQVSVITCLQVLEHVEDARPFVDAIFATATYRVILSVPYMWPAGTCESHVNDPINRAKLRGWAKRKPTRTKLVRDAGNERLVEEYKP